MRKDTPRDIIQCEKTQISLDLGRSLAEFYRSGSDESMVADISVPSPFAFYNVLLVSFGVFSCFFVCEVPSSVLILVVKKVSISLLVHFSFQMM